MKKLPLWLTALLLVAGVAAGASALSIPSRSLAGSDDPNDKGWPRQYISGGDTLFVYQPQLESWQGNVLTGRAAVAVYSPGAQQADYGVVWFSSRTDVDKSERRVRFSDVHLTRVNFPGSPDGGAAYQRVLQKTGLGITSVSLDRVESNLAITKARLATRRVEVKNDAPDIQFATSPSLLVLIDGDPVVRPVEGTRLTRVINTRALIVSEDGRTWYLAVGDSWLRAPQIRGPYVYADRVPGSIAQIVPAEDQSGAVDTGQDLDDDVKALLDEGKAPNVFVRTAPTELIVSDGPLDFRPIEDTELLFADNTPADVFVDVPTQARYVLISGRWFRAASFDGPWEFVPPDELPEDFARIPEDHPKGSVLASVEGTPQSEEASIANDIPQTAEVQRNQAKLQTEYDGEPEFQDIEGTGLAYAENTDTPVIRFRPDRYYAVSNGVWFTATSPDGPWYVATDIPPAIYGIPPSCPVYYVTYVQVYYYTPSVVYVGYTPGYFGTCLSPWGTVVYGTGWRWRPWCHHHWHGYPWTYGWGAAFSWSSWSGWSFGFGFGSTPYWRPWWGPAGWAWGWTGPYRPYYCVSTYDVYRHWSPAVIAGRRRPAYGYVPPRGGRYPMRPMRPTATGQPSGPVERPAYYPSALTRPAIERGPAEAVGGMRPARPGGGVQPVGPGPGVTTPPTRPGGGVQPVEPGRGVTPPPTRPAPAQRPEPRPGGIQPTRPEQAPQPTVPPITRPGARPTPRPGDVYAGPDGNVYRPTPNGWQKFQGTGRWEGVKPQQPQARPMPSSDLSRQLERDRFARQRGETRTQSWQQSRGGNAGSFDAGQPRVTMPQRGSTPVPQRTVQPQRPAAKPQPAPQKQKPKESKPGDKR